MMMMMRQKKRQQKSRLRWRRGEPRGRGCVVPRGCGCGSHEHGPVREYAAVSRSDSLTPLKISRREDLSTRSCLFLRDGSAARPSRESICIRASRLRRGVVETIRADTSEGRVFINDYLKLKLLKPDSLRCRRHGNKNCLSIGARERSHLPADRDCDEGIIK